MDYRSLLGAQTVASISVGRTHAMAIGDLPHTPAHLLPEASFGWQHRFVKTTRLASLINGRFACKPRRPETGEGAGDGACQGVLAGLLCCCL
jgi:hypothetical protein